MLSILIPIYNYNAFPLVKKLSEQANQSGILYEIVCLNDASSLFIKENLELSQLNSVRYEVSEKNLGRSKTRNKLAQMAQYDWLLFLDTDVMPVDDFLIERYLPFLNDEKQAVYGGIVYSDKKPEKPFTVELKNYNKDRGPAYTISYDGIYIGATWARDMRNLMVASFAIYLAAWWLLQPFGNSGLWGALLIFFMARGLLQAWRYPSLAQTTFADTAPQLTPAKAPQ